MKQKICLVLLTIVMSVISCGCSVLFADTYYSEKDFQGNQGLDLDSDVERVQTYAELRRQVFNLMNEHGESLELLFPGYTGNVVSDIASVCNAIQTESAYGAFCVEYISYDLTQIVSYYEAVITISYKYTAEELASMQTVSDMDEFSVLVADELEKGNTEFVVRVNNGISDDAAVSQLIQHTVRSSPLSVSYFPKITLKTYSGNSSQHIYEMNVQYDDVVDNEQRIAEMEDEIEKASRAFHQLDEKKRICDAAMYLSARCSVADEAGTTAYDALISGAANSEGVASAFKALCDYFGVECLIVNGRLDRMDHFWNIIKFDDDFYHVDVSVLTDRGEEALFQRDEVQQVNYWWDQSAYPDCEGELTYHQIVS